MTAPRAGRARSRFALAACVLAAIALWLPRNLRILDPALVPRTYLSAFLGNPPPAAGAWVKVKGRFAGARGKREGFLEERGPGTGKAPRRLRLWLGGGLGILTYRSSFAGLRAGDEIEVLGRYLPAGNWYAGSGSVLVVERIAGRAALQGLVIAALELFGLVLFALFVYAAFRLTLETLRRGKGGAAGGLPA